LSGNATVTGRVEGDSLVLQRNSRGVNRSNRIKLSGEVICSICVPEWLSRQSPDVRECSVNIINIETLKTEPGHFKRIATEAGVVRWEAVRQLGVVLSRGRIDLDGPDCIREEFDVLNFSKVRRTRQEAQDIRPLVQQGRDLLMFPIDKDIARPDLLDSITVRLTWDNIPLDQFVLEDGRQKIVSHSEKDGRHEAIVQITNVKSDSTSSTVRFPVTGDEFKPQLTETDFLKPANEKIIARSKEWTKGSVDALSAVKSLSRNVFELMNGGSMIAETLSGPEVLECREGKCSEFSTLFGSLARSLGIPTRIVLGDRLANGHWVGHMWNECWVGEWVTVDSTTNEVGSAPALLKFIHSDTVAGTQHLRFALTKSLDIGIDEFRLRETATDPDWKTGVTGLTYTNSDYHCRVSVPGQKWKIEDKSKAGQVVVRLHVPGHPRVQLHFVAYNLPQAFDAKTFIGIRKTHFAEKYNEYKLLDEGPKKHSDREWETLRFSRKPNRVEAKNNGSQNPIKTTEYAWHKGTAGFLINIIAEESAHDALVDELSEIVDSFDIKPTASDDQ